jgi:hypothetical protein
VASLAERAASDSEFDPNETSSQFTGSMPEPAAATP